MLEAWIAPSSHTENSWQQEGKAYDNVDPDYTVIDELTGYPNYPETQAIFDEENDSGWTDPLTLGLGYSITIKGFRIIANKPKTYDNQTHDEIPGYDYMELKFYNGDAWKTTVTITNWEGGSWRIIDFQDLFYATLVGDDEPLVNRVEIRIHENMSTKSFDDHPASISEFDFWFVSGPTGEGEVESLPLAPLAFNEVGFSTIANNLGMSGVTEYVNTETSPQTTMLEDGEELLTYSEETGMLEYIKPSQAYPIAASEPALPSDAGAISMALTMLVNNGLPAEEFTLKTITYDTQGAGDKYTDEVFYDWITAKTVYFERQLSGVALPELTKVTIGMDGTVAAFSIPLLTLES